MKEFDLIWIYVFVESSFHVICLTSIESLTYDLTYLIYYI